MCLLAVHYFISCYYFVHYVIDMCDMPLTFLPYLGGGGYILVVLPLGLDSSG